MIILVCLQNLIMSTIFALSILVSCGGETEFAQSATIRTELDAWTERANRMEQTNVYSEANLPMNDPSNNPDYHLPIVSIDQEKGYVNAYVAHVMQREHWITTVYFRDQEGTVFYLKELLPGDSDLDNNGNPKEKGVTWYTEIPKGATKVAAFAFCNLHGHWYSGQKDL